MNLSISHNSKDTLFMTGTHTRKQSVGDAIKIENAEKAKSYKLPPTQNQKFSTFLDLLLLSD
jgi:hypothetical protein